MAKHISIGQPVNEYERNGIAFLKRRLPETFTLITNFELKQGTEIFEVDLAIIAPQCVFVVDIKNMAGHIDIDEKWHPENRASFPSPLAKLRSHARIISSTIRDFNRIQRQTLAKIHVQAAVLFTSLHTTVKDYNGKDEISITYLDQRCLSFFQSSDLVPPHRLQQISSYFGVIENAIRGKSRPISAPKQYRDWILEQKLGSGDRFEEYRARHCYLNDSFGRLRIYQAEPYPDPDTPDPEKKRILSTFVALRQIKHPNIISVSEFFETQDGDRFILVLDDIQGQTLRQYLRTPSLTLSLKQKLDVMSQVLSALSYAHEHGVIHRNLSPDNIILTHKGQVILTGFEYARTQNRTSTIADDIIDDLNYAYQPLECQRDPAQASIASDLFSAGAVFYELLTGKKAFANATEMYEYNAIFPQAPSQIIAELPTSLDQWLQQLCKIDPQDRFANADIALEELTPIATLEKIDLANLAPNTPIGDRYLVRKRLGRPGSFGVAYKVFDTTGEVEEVLKFVTGDKRSNYERVKQEYKILRQLPEHPFIVKVRSSEELPDRTPYIVFDYVEGQDLATYLTGAVLSLEQSITIAKQVAEGLAHLHSHKVYHQDIKLSNLLLTDHGIKLIDFNIAVSELDESPISAGTRRYLPPNFDLRKAPSTEAKIDRDLYALGIVFYECVTGQYPFVGACPNIGEMPRDPHSFTTSSNLNPELKQFMLKAIAPKRQDRFADTKSFLDELNAVTKPQNLEGDPDVHNKLIEKSIIDNTLEKVAELVDKTFSDVTASTVQIHTGKAIEVSTSIGDAVNNAGKVIADTISNLSGNHSISQDDYSNIDNLADNLKHKPQAPDGLAEVEVLDSKTPPNDDQIKPVPVLPTELAVVLDPTELYDVPQGFFVIASEIDWMQYFGREEHSYWVKGDFLCQWTREWLQLRGKTDAILEEKQDPRSRLESLFQRYEREVPAEWSDTEILRLVTKLDSFNSRNPIAELLAEATGDRDVWFGTPSAEHLVKWLNLQVPDAIIPFEQLWQKQVSQAGSNLAGYYNTSNKLQLLRQWIGITEPTIAELGNYPFLTVPEVLSVEFEHLWELKICQSDASILNKLTPNQIGLERILGIAHRFLTQQPQFIVREQIEKLPYATNQRSELLNLIPPTIPEPLSIEAHPEEALQWATDRYLPYRRWEIVVKRAPIGERLSDEIAASFEDWMLLHYPNLKVDAVDNSYLNYNVAYLVMQLCQQHPVLWVVVDGLGWLDHIELLHYLKESTNFVEQTSIEPRFSILPTKTEYAKWSLYSQLPCNDSDWQQDMSKVFPKLGIGARYTDLRDNRLYEDLHQSKHKLYCLDTEQLDKLYHSERDLDSLHSFKRKDVLKRIANQISYCIKQYPRSSDLKVVIASDHGQILGDSFLINEYPPELSAKGRMAIGRTDDPRFAVLDADRYGLPHDISVVRGAGCLGAFNTTTSGDAIGTHGGLFPEEVVIGVSILTQHKIYSQVIATCKGKGKAKQAGKLTVVINNRLNNAAISELCIYINEIAELQYGKKFGRAVDGGQKKEFTIAVGSYPELPVLHSSDRLKLTGYLTYKFGNNEPQKANLLSESAIEIEQMFVSGMEGGIDEFL